MPFDNDVAPADELETTATDPSPEPTPVPVAVEVPVAITITTDEPAPVPEPFVCPFNEPQCNVVDGFCKHCGYTP